MNLPFRHVKRTFVIILSGRSLHYIACLHQAASIPTPRFANSKAWDTHARWMGENRGDWATFGYIWLELLVDQVLVVLCPATRLYAEGNPKNWYNGANQRRAERYCL